jgi:hypothetical protein
MGREASSVASGVVVNMIVWPTIAVAGAAPPLMTFPLHCIDDPLHTICGSSSTSTFGAGAAAAAVGVAFAASAGAGPVCGGGVGKTWTVAPVAPASEGVPPFSGGPVFGAEVGETVAVISVPLTTFTFETAIVTSGLVCGADTLTSLTAQPEVAAAGVVKPVPVMVML